MASQNFVFHLHTRLWRAAVFPCRHWGTSTKGCALYDLRVMPAQVHQMCGSRIHYSVLKESTRSVSLRNVEKHSLILQWINAGGRFQNCVWQEPCRTVSWLHFIYHGYMMNVCYVTFTHWPGWSLMSICPKRAAFHSFWCPVLIADLLSPLWWGWCEVDRTRCFPVTKSPFVCSYSPNGSICKNMW